MSIRLTIAIPTHNRAHTLAATLASVADQQVPLGWQLECVVVDNNSSDRTGAIIEQAARVAPFPIRYVKEMRLGSSFARNRVLEESTGDYILFIDDDAVAEPDWAEALVDEIERWRLDVACGMVLPLWEVPPPKWLGPSLYIRLAVHDEGGLAGQSRANLETIHNYFSVNAGFRRATFARYGRFREDLGVVGCNPMSGEDTELFERIMARGGLIGFAARARVHHRIGKERMTRAYFRRKAFAFGVGSANAGAGSHNHFDKLARHSLRMIMAAVRGDAEGALRHELECANFLGYWRGRLFRR
ncbi:MAG: glycosyltransferase family 2 protein [Candidatus Binataceae bacterium]